MVNKEPTFEELIATSYNIKQFFVKPLNANTLAQKMRIALYESHIKINIPKTMNKKMEVKTLDSTKSTIQNTPKKMALFDSNAQYSFRMFQIKLLKDLVIKESIDTIGIIENIESEKSEFALEELNFLSSPPLKGRVIALLYNSQRCLIERKYLTALLVLISNTLYPKRIELLIEKIWKFINIVSKENFTRRTD